MSKTASASKEWKHAFKLFRAPKVFETKSQRTHKTTMYNPPADSQIKFFTSSLNRSILDCFHCHLVHSFYNYKSWFVIELCNSVAKVQKRNKNSKYKGRNFIWNNKWHQGHDSMSPVFLSLDWRTAHWVRTEVHGIVSLAPNQFLQQTAKGGGVYVRGHGKAYRSAKTIPGRKVALPRHPVFVSILAGNSIRMIAITPIRFIIIYQRSY